MSSQDSPAPVRRLPWGPIAALALAAMLALGAFVSPWFAFLAMRSAAQAGDLGGLEEVVDYGALRASLRPQVRERLRAPQAQPPSQPRTNRPAWLPEFIPYPSAAPLERALRPWNRELETTREIERLTSPPGLAALSSGKAWVRDWGLQRFRVDVRPASAPRTTAPATFTFDRRGAFEWKLVHLGLPSGAATAAEALAAPEQVG